MKKSLWIISILFFTVSNFIYAQEDPVILEYINTYKELAIQEMIRTGVPASIKLAQGIHETEAGNSVLVKKSNNHFGIKCKTGWEGMSVRHTDDRPNECFRKYSTPEDSYKDHSDFLKSSSRYASLFLLDPTDYKDWAYGLKKAGYATNPRYAQAIIKLIEDYHLQDYSLIALGKMKQGEEFWAKNSPGDDNSGAAEELVVEIPAEDAVVMEPEEEVVIRSKRNTEQIKVKPESPVYPSGEFKLNETRVIYAKSGTSYLVIANQYNVPLFRIFEFNDMKPEEFVAKDQLIFLMRKRKVSHNELHTVLEGETLHDIAQTEALRIESLVEYNSLKKGTKPVPGTKLFLRERAVNKTSYSSEK